MRTYSERIKSLIEDMSIEEKINQLSCTIPLLLTKNGKVEQQLLKDIIPHGIGRITQFAGGFFEGPKQAAEAYNTIQTHVMNNSPHAIPAIIQNEAIVGLVAAKATAFPIPLAVACTWDATYAKKMGDVIQKEASAIGVNMCLSPVSDVARDARWGRVGETYGEDPFLTTQFSINSVQGLQGTDIKTQVASCAKHFMGYAASEGGINTAKVALPEKELLEVHGTPFAAMIQEANLEGVMVTYSELDGLPMSVNTHYMNDVLRSSFGFEGVAICDALSIPRAFQSTGIGKDMIDVVKWALEAGIDADTPLTQAYTCIKDGIDSKRISLDLVDEAVKRVLDQKERLGLFDQPFLDSNKATEQFSLETSKVLSEEIARKELVLLKNNGILPLKDNKKIAVIGPFAKKVSTLFGGYAYTKFIEMFANATYHKKSKMEGVAKFFDQFIDKEYTRKALNLDTSISYDDNIETYIKKEYGIESIWDCLLHEFPTTSFSYTKGIQGDDDWQLVVQHAKELAKDVDVILLTLGEVTGFGEDASSGEGTNNTNLALPAHQEALLKALSETGKPIVLMLFNSRPLILTNIEHHCSAILEAWYPGPYGAKAIVETLSGKYNPGGKLAITFPRSSAQCPIYYGNHAGSGYLELDHSRSELVDQPLYPFGYGLSYTEFAFRDFIVEDVAILTEAFSVSVIVKNIGMFFGDEVVQLYSRTKHASVVRPTKELRAFQRITLAPGEEKRVSFTLHTNQFGYYNRNLHFVVEPSDIELLLCTDAETILDKVIVSFQGEECVVSTDRRFCFHSMIESVI